MSQTNRSARADSAIHALRWISVAILLAFALQNIPSFILQRVPGVQAQMVEGPGATSGAASAESGHGGLSDPFPYALLAVALMLVAIMFGHWLARRFGQPPVLGELLIGMIVGNLGYWLGIPFFIVTMRLGEAAPLFNDVWKTGKSVVAAAHDVFPPEAFEPGGVAQELLSLLSGEGAALYVNMGFALWAASNLGVVLLLFMVGLESSVAEMMRVGGRSLAVAIVGIVLPFVLGFLGGAVLIPGASTVAHLYLGAILTATSVGITARVFNDLGMIKRPESRVVLGAAVIDDVLGLIILAVMVGMVTTGQIQAPALIRIVVASAMFLGIIMFAGEWFIRKIAPFFHAMDGPNSKLMFPLALAFVVAWLASTIELSVIVGAYAAGLILSDEHFRGEEGESSTTIHQWIHPLEKFLAPVFFLLMGLQVDLASFANFHTVLLAVALIVLAIVGKVVSGLFAGKACDWLTVGLGMMPRGEVGLIFAGIGKSLGVVDASVFSAIVIVVMVTTLLAPPALKWSVSRPAMKRRMMEAMREHEAEILEGSGTPTSA